MTTPNDHQQPHTPGPNPPERDHTQPAPPPARSPDEIHTQGLTPAHTDTTELLELPPRRRLSPRSIAIQIIGIAISIALLAWAITLLLSEDNRQNLQRLTEAPPTTLALLLAVTIASIALNGLIFWTTLKPIRSLPPLYLIAINALITFLAILPFKINLATRVLIHHRRDGIPFRDIIAWLAAGSALALLTLIPPFLATAWRGDIDPLWIATIITTITAGAIAAIVCGRIAADQATTPGKWLARLSLGSWRIVQHPRIVAAAIGLRAADIATLAARFIIAGAIIQQQPAWETAILYASAYFILSVITPAGSIGIREGGVLGLGSLAGQDLESLATITLIVSASELLIAAAIALPTAIIIRPDKLISRRHPTPPPTPPGSPPPPSPEHGTPDPPRH